MAKYSRSTGNPFKLGKRASTKKASPSVPPLQSMDRLSLEDLNKIRTAIETYRTKCSEVRAKNEPIHKKNNQLTQEFDLKRSAQNAAYSKHNRTLNELKVEIERLRSSLRLERAGMVTSWLTEIVEFEGEKYYKSAKIKIDDIKRKEHSFAETIAGAPKYISEYATAELQKLVPIPNDYADLILGGVRTRIEFKSIEEQDLNRLIQERTFHKESKKEEINQLRARASKAEEEIRAMAGPYKRDLDNQLQKLTGCPYCAGTLTASNAHLDHIYPVAKGGHSVRRNLVFVCASCNLKKRDLTLRIFIAHAKLDATKVYERLDLLGKDA